MRKLLEIQDYVDQKRKQIDKALEKIFPPGDILEEAARYSLLSPGHRWRPILTLTLAENYNNPYPDLLNLACTTECMHTASLIQDDLPCMDNQDLRRGKPTCHVKYGEDIANLTIINLVNAAWITMINHSPDEHGKKLFNEAYRTGVGMFKGQKSDLRDKLDSEEKIFKMYADKSGELFSLASFLGMFHTDWDPKRIRTFGRYLGIAYQIADDLKDELLSREEIGKNTGQDTSKPTIINLLSIKQAREMAEEYKQKAMQFTKGKSQLEQLLNEIIKIN